MRGARLCVCARAWPYTRCSPAGAHLGTAAFQAERKATQSILNGVQCWSAERVDENDGSAVFEVRGALQQHSSHAQRSLAATRAGSTRSEQQRRGTRVCLLRRRRYVTGPLRRIACDTNRQLYHTRWHTAERAATEDPEFTLAGTLDYATNAFTLTISGPQGPMDVWSLEMWCAHHLQPRPQTPCLVPGKRARQ